MMTKHFLNDWEFSLQTNTKLSGEVKYNKWYKAAVPGTVYHNLIINKIIPDPFYADNELRLQWIAGADWSYRTAFNIPDDYEPDKKLILVFEGIDTAAEIILNGSTIGAADNMFCKYEFDVSSLLNKKNILEVKFTSTYTYAKEKESVHGKLPVALNSERVYIRKAQYSFGWDWGPAFADIGIWKPVYLIQRENTFIENFTFSTTSITDNEASARINIFLNQQPDIDHKIILSLSDSSGTSEYRLEHQGEKIISDVINIRKPILWWPNGEGEQHLYELKILLYKNETLQDILIKKTGIRTVQLVRNTEIGKTFRFRINGKDIFARGANWIPADSFLTRIDDTKYSSLLAFAKNAGMNFIRVWGGGIYEQDKFYELCDELGLLVWQDFMFACAAYPEHGEFIENVKKEIFQNVLKLQYHPSVALWCGNNENEWIWFQEQNRSYTEMPGYKIYSEVIPEIINQLDPQRPYWQSSPFSEDESDPNSPLSGNRHQWNLWSRWIDYNEVKHDYSLFVTEFGFQGPANQSTFEKVIPPEQRNPQSYLFEFHNKQVEGNERQFKFLAGHLPVKTGWSDFIYLAQLNQALALKTCLEHWRFNYPHTNGTIIWQLNDCWPVSSWSLIDSDLKLKLSYYLVKRSFAPHLIKFETNNNAIDLFLLNFKNDFRGYANIYSIVPGKGKSHLIKKVKIKAEKNQQKVFTINCSDEIASGEIIIAAELYSVNDELISENIFSAIEWKYQKIKPAKIKYDLIGKKDKSYLSLKSDVPAFFVSVYSDDLLLTENCLTLLPGEAKKIPIENKISKKTSLRIFSLNDYLE